MTAKQPKIGSSAAPPASPRSIRPAEHDDADLAAGANCNRPGLDPLLLTGRGITLGSISVGSRADFEAMNRAIALHRLRPVIDRTFPFAEAKAAYRHFEGRGHFGKVVIAHS